MEPKEWAHKLVNDFTERTRGDGLWPRLRPRDKVAESLHVRIDDPDCIAQRNTNVCGIAAFIRDWAYDDPVWYAWLGICLYELGNGLIGRGNHANKRIIPSTELRTHPVPFIKGRGEMDYADWMILASVRESFNDVLRYPGPNVPLINWEEISAINFPADVEAAFKAAGYVKVINKATWHSSAGYDNANDASDKFEQGYRVILLINARMLATQTQDTRAFIPTSDHWVALASPIETNLWAFQGADTEAGRVGIRLKIWTWGETEYRKIPATGDWLPLTAFAKNYYGYVAAKY